jgi:hypothetical protein
MIGKKYCLIFSILFLVLIIGNVFAPVTPISADNCNGADINRNGRVGVEDMNMFNDERRMNCGHIHPLNALNVINHLNSEGPGTANTNYEYVLDTDKDGHVSPIDALILINKMNFCSDLPSVALDSNADFDKDGFIQGNDMILFLDALDDYPIGSSCAESFAGLEIFVYTSKERYSVGERIELK